MPVVFCYISTFTRKDSMLCSYCKKSPPMDGVKKCATCTEKVRISNKKYVEKTKRKGICPRCGKNPLPVDRGRCIDCNEKHYNEIKLTREDRIGKGLCAECGQCSPTGTSKSCETCVLKAMAKFHFKDVRKWADLRRLYDSNFVCPYTGIELTLGLNASLDHRVPKSKGGTDEISNLQFVHVWCNSMKNDTEESTFKEELRSFVLKTIEYLNEGIS